MKPTLVLFLCVAVTLASLGQPTPVPKQGAALLKTDVMGVFAHPDDETGVAAALMYYALGKGAIVANVYCTRGEGGGNMVGTQSGAALGALREAELRDCLSTLGVRYCYFLDQLDWAYTESLAATLEKWGKEQTLERLVRFVRLLRPEIMITMNPAPTPGQHGHHQAAAVLATEAFTAAADPHRFPLQLTREGLPIWQPRRLFYGGGGNEQGVFTIAVDQPLPDGRTPGAVAGMAMANHRSQAFGNPGNASWLQRPRTFTLVKAFVPVPESRDDLLQGLPTADTTMLPVSIGPTRPLAPFDFEFVPRPAFAHYRQWVKQQGIQHVATRFETDLPVVTGETNLVRLRLALTGTSPVEGDLNVTAPAGWDVHPLAQHIKVSADAPSEIPLYVTVPASLRTDTEIKASFNSSASVAEAKAKLHPLPRSRAIHLAKPPALDGTDSGWENVPTLTISPADLVEGKVANDFDSSAVFRLAYDDTTFYVDVLVKDDVVVTNIAPNDIKGHWRSDSIEICFDPVGGAEHTMGCFKLGIFPFDTTGVVRGERDADANQGLLEETAPKTRLSSRRTAEGYRIQTAIPLQEIGIARSQKRIGFNLIIYDGDKKDAALGENINKSRIAWAPRAGVQGRPEDWGRIDLE